jgi:oligopeptidase B
MSPDPAPPAAPRRPHRMEAHGDVRTDDWYWLGDREDPEVLSYLAAENAYADAALASTADLQDRIFAEVKSRVVETDVDAPVRHGAWWYWSRTVEGQQYRITCRRHDPDRRLDAVTVLADARAGAGDEDVVIDENALAGDSEYFALGVFDLTPDQDVLAYAVDLDGSEQYSLRFRDLRAGVDLTDRIEGVSYGSAWGADNATFFYVRTDEAMRPYQVWRHTLGSDAASDTLVYENLDERFFVSVGATRSERFVVIYAGSKMTSVAFAIDAARPDQTPATVLPMVEGVEYDIEHAVWPDSGDVWLVRTNRPGDDGTPATDFSLLRLPVGGGPDDLEVVVGHRPGVRLVDVDAFAAHVIVTERSEGLERLRILRLATGDDELIAQPDPVYSILGQSNPEWDSVVYRFGYTSLVTPPSTIDYALESGERHVVRVQPVVGYDPARFRTERIWAEAPDGTSVPISLVCRADVPVDGTAPCLLYGYGAYELTVDPTFSALRLSLLERGVVFAIAHIRGGGELGRTWYEQGRLAAKPNTFNDFVACAEHLVKTGWAAPDRLAIRGGSAGGLLMGAVVNLRPDLWRAVVAEVPFVDVVTTMSDTSLPLTVTEWEEWGDPVADPDAYRVMRSYSPYDNVVARDYPAMYVTAGLNDPRVGYWEPAKWVAKLRTLRTDDRPMLLRTELEAGHQGVSGRYAAWRDEARVYAFILTSLGIDS